MRQLRTTLLVAPALIVLLVVLLAAAPARAASPEPSPGVGAADTRSTGEAPGFVGAPLMAIAGVIALGALAVVGTVAYIRLTGGPGPATASDGTRGPARGDSPAAR